MEPTITTTTTAPSEELIRFMAQAAVLAKIAKREAGEAFDRTEAEAIEAMIASGILSVTLPDGTQVTVVTPERLSVDVEVLEQNLPMTVLAKVTKRSVDLTKYKAAVEAGLISPEIAAKAGTLSPADPSLRITAKAKAPK